MKRFLKLTAFPCLTVLATALFLSWKHFDISHWPQTQATIISSDVEWVGVGGNKGYYHPAIKYNYAVQGQIYVSSRYEFCEFGIDYPPIFGGTKADAQKLIVNFPEGQSRPVFYNPSNPAFAVLRPGLNSQYVGTYLLGYFVCSVGAQMWALRILRWRKQKEKR